MGPILHKHSYAETWIVRGGNAAFTVGDQKIAAGAADMSWFRKKRPTSSETSDPARSTSSASILRPDSSKTIWSEFAKRV